MKKFAIRTLILLGILTLLLTIVTVSSVSWLINTEAGAKRALYWAQIIVPELQIEQPNGTLWRGLAMQSLSWKSEGVRVEVKNVSASWLPSCFWKFHLCIEQLSARSVFVAVDSSADNEAQTQSADSVLADVFLPMALEVESSEIGRLQLHLGADLVVDNLAVKGRWQGYTVTLEESAFDLYDQGWSVRGNIRLEKNYPLFAVVNIAPESALAEHLGLVKVRAFGDLAELELEADTHGTWPLRARGRLSPLDERLPFFLTAKLSEKKAIELGGDTLTLDQPEAVLKGDLERFKVQLTSNLQSTLYPGQHRLNARAHGNLESLILQDARLQLQEGLISAQGKLQVNEAWEWQGDVDWKDIRTDVWLSKLQGKSQGKASVRGKFEDSQTIMTGTVHDGRLDLSDGNIEINGQFWLDESFRWSSNIVWQDLNPATWLAQSEAASYWPSSVIASSEGSASVTGQYRDALDQLHVAIHESVLKSAEGNVDLVGQFWLDKNLRWASNIVWQDLNPATWLAQSEAASYWPSSVIASSEGSASVTGQYRDALDQLHVAIHESALKSAEGNVDLAGQFWIDEGVRWSGDLTWLGVNPAIWSDKVPQGFASQLAGRAAIKGEYVDGLKALKLNLKQGDGDWVGREFHASGELDFENQTWNIPGFALTHGDNQISINGKVGSQSNLLVKLLVPDASHLWPDLKAATEAEFSVTGALAEPSVEGEIKMLGLEYEQLRAEQVTLDFNYHHAPNLSNADAVFDLQALSLNLNGQVLESIQINAEGSGSSHQFSLNTSGHSYARRSSLTCSGRLDDSLGWDGICDEVSGQFEIRALSQTHDVINQAPIKFRWAHLSKQFSLQPFCMISGGASLCNEVELVVSPEKLSGIKLQARQLNWVWLSPLFPDNWQVSGRNDLVLQVDDYVFADSAKGLAKLKATSKELNLVRQAPDDAKSRGAGRLEVPVKDLIVEAQFQNRKLEGQVLLNASQFGEVSASIGVDEWEDIQGTVEINRIDLAAFELLAPGNTRASGYANANLRLGGAMRSPQITGSVRIQNATLDNENLPTPLSGIFIDVDFDQRQANLQGRFVADAAESSPETAGVALTDSSSGTLQGSLKWRDTGWQDAVLREMRQSNPELRGKELDDPDWQAQLRVQTDRMRLMPQPDSLLEVKPDVTLFFTPGTIAVTGLVEVPKANILINELPKQTVSPSSDATMRGNQSVDSNQLNFIADLKLLLGDNVRFKGFGLETNLTGQMDFSHRADRPLQSNGIVQLQEGRFRAYGQRLTIRRGSLIFLGDLTNPDVSIEAIRSNLRDNVEVGLRATGPIRNPQVRLFSQPAMPDQVRMQYLLTGKGPGESTIRDQQLARKAALSLSLAGTDSYIGEVAEKLGVEDFEIGTEDSEAGTQLQLSGYVSPDLFIQYGHGIFEEANAITMRYRLAKDLFLEAVSSSANALDLIYSFEVE